MPTPPPSPSTTIGPVSISVGHVGGAVAEWNWTAAGTLEPIKHNDAGFAGGAQVGLQKQWDWIVVGAEVSYTWTDVGSTKPSAFLPGTLAHEPGKRPAAGHGAPRVRLAAHIGLRQGRLCQRRCRIRAPPV
jgi:hypothetical protein